MIKFVTLTTDENSILPQFIDLFYKSKNLGSIGGLASPMKMPNLSIC